MIFGIEWAHNVPEAELKLPLKGHHVVVTGGCGFIGSHLTSQLLRLGVARVTIVDNLRYGSRDNLDADDDRIDVIAFTLGEDSIVRLEEPLQNATYLFHLAAEKHNQSSDSPERVIARNIDGTQALFEAAARAGIRRTVFSSSLYVYGQMAGPAMTEEQLPLPHTIYGITKLAGEHLLQFHTRNSNMTGTSLRYFFTYGPRQFAGLGYKSVIVKNFERIAAGTSPIILGDGQQTLDYLYVDDLVEATIMALTADEMPAVINTGSGQGVTINDLTDRMLAVASSDLKPVSGSPDWTAGTRRVANTQLAANTLGWQPKTSLDDGLRKTYEWISQS